MGISEMISKVIFGRGWVKEGQQHHYDVHAELDVDHARELLNVARPGWNENAPSVKRDIAHGLLLAAQSFWQLYGNMFLTIQPAKSVVPPGTVNALQMSQEIVEKSALTRSQELQQLEQRDETPLVNIEELGDPFVLGLKVDIT